MDSSTEMNSPNLDFEGQGLVIFMIFTPEARVSDVYAK
jgi:hypothetical protein